MKKDMPPGMKKFQEDLLKIVRNPGTENANIDCMECGRQIFLVGMTWTSMHVFVFPDAPYHTTKGVCFGCLNKLVAEHGGKQIGQELN